MADLLKVSTTPEHRTYKIIDTYIHNHEPRLSCRAKGIFTYLATRPEEWVLRENDLINRFSDGRDSIRAGLRELEQAGYLIRAQPKSADGTFGGGIAALLPRPVDQPTTERLKQWLVENANELNNNKLTLSGFPPSAGNPQTGCPSTGNPPSIVNLQLLGRTTDSRDGASAPPPTGPTSFPLHPGVEKPPVGSRRRQAPVDSRKDHPVIAALRSVWKKYPAKELWDHLIEHLGPDVDSKRLQACRTEWVERGYNKESLKWATEWYVRGIPNGARAGKASATANRSQPGKYDHLKRTIRDE